MKLSSRPFLVTVTKSCPSGSSVILATCFPSPSDAKAVDAALKQLSSSSYSQLDGLAGSSEPQNPRMTSIGRAQSHSGPISDEQYVELYSPLTTL